MAFPPSSSRSRRVVARLWDAPAVRLWLGVWLFAMLCLIPVLGALVTSLMFHALVDPLMRALGGGM